MDDIDDFDDYVDSCDSEDEDLAEAYCEAKEKKPLGSSDAVDAFEFVLALEQRDAQLTEWGFKALKQLLKLGAAKGSAEVLRNYKRILAYHSAVSDSQMEKACLKVLALLPNVESFREFGQITNDGLKDTKSMMWSRMSIRLAKTFFSGGHDADALLVLADVKNTVQGNARLAAVADSLLLDVYKLEAEIRIRKREFEQIAELRKAAESHECAENPAAMSVINECFAVRLILSGQYCLANVELIAAGNVHSDERSEHVLRCCQLIVMNAALREGADNDDSGALVFPQPTDVRVLAASQLAQLYRTEHGDAFLTAAQEFLANDTDPLVACVLDQWTSRVRKAQAELKYCLDYPGDTSLARNVVFQADRFARLRKMFAAEPNEYIRKLCVTRAWAAELQYWLRLGEDPRVRDVVHKALIDQEGCDLDLNDSSAALLREFCGRSFFELGCLSYAQRSLRAALLNCSMERVNGCAQLLVLVCLLLGEDDDVAQQNLEETTFDILQRLTKHVCTFEPSDCVRLLSDADCTARLDPFIVKALYEWIAKMEPVKQCVREVEARLALEHGDYATLQHVEELKQKVKDESNETVKLLCLMQLCVAELQFTHATGDFMRLRDVLAEIRSSVLKSLNVTSIAEKVVDDRTSATGIIQGRMQLIDGKVSEALSTFLSAAQTYASCGSTRLAACKELVLFCGLMQHAAGERNDFPSTESADEALLELMVQLTAAIAKADLAAMRSIVDGPSFAELAKDGMHDAVSHWLETLDNTSRFLTTAGQELIDGSDYLTLDQTLEDIMIPVQIFNKLTRDTWLVRLWSLEVQLGYHCQDNKHVDGNVERMERLSVSVQHSEPAGIVLEFSGKRYLRANDRPRALERFQQALQVFEINESSRRFANARYIALTQRPNQPLSAHLHEQYASTAGVGALSDLMGAYYADERHRFYELMVKDQELRLDTFVAERLRVHYDALKARICSRPIQLPTETWEVVLSMLRIERGSVQSTCSMFRETSANVFNLPRN